MAKIDSATLKIGIGNYWLAPVGTAVPEDLLEPGVGWENLGHTSLEDILANESEGGEATVLGTLQNPSLRTTYSARTETFGINLQQWDEASLRLYFGSNATSDVANGMLQVPIVPAPTAKAFLAVFEDGANAFGLYAPKVEIMRADNFELSDTESLASLPLSIRPMLHGTNKWAYAITPLQAV